MPRKVIYVSRKSRGLSTEPWGTPERTLDESLLVLFKITLCDLLDKKSLIQSNGVP